jgi:hypothetical protein
MVFGPNLIPAQRIDLEALKALPPWDSDEWYIALLERSSPALGCHSVRSCFQRELLDHYRLVFENKG